MIHESETGPFSDDGQGPMGTDDVPKSSAKSPSSPGTEAITTGKIKGLKT